MNGSDPESRGEARAIPSPGLCGRCRHAEIVSSKRSRFLRCRRADTDPAFARYPRLPVLDCQGYPAVDPAPR